MLQRARLTEEVKKFIGIARRSIFSKRSRLTRLLSILLVLIILTLFTRQRTQISTRLAPYIPDYITSDDCSKYPDNSHVVIVVKTGATEAPRLIPTLLKTALRCVKDPIIVSDLEQQIAGVKLHDVLADFSPRAMERNPDFEIYHVQQQYKTEGREKDLPKLSSMPIADPTPREPGKSAAWGLDKYKNIRMVELAWRLRPDRDWYFFIDADTYVVWNNLLTWLSTLDISKSKYIGQPVRMSEHRPRPLDYGHGGAGVLLSRATVRELSEQRPGLLQRWDQRIGGWWHGDFLLADALDEELDLNVTDGTPMLGADPPTTIPYGPYNWCRPIVTAHHLDAADAQGLYKADRAAGSQLLLGKDVYHSAPRPEMPKLRHDWDNMSNDGRFKISLDRNDTEYAHHSFAACEAACQNESNCFMFTFSEQSETLSNGAKRAEGTCHLSSVFRMGKEQRPEQWGEKQEFKKTYTSGWNLVRILWWTMTNNECKERKDLWEFGPGIVDIKKQKQKL